MFNINSPKNNHQKLSKMPRMTYSDGCLSDHIKVKIKQFTRKEGRRPRMLISSMESQKFGEKTLKIAKSLAELGFDIDIGSINQTIEQVARTAVENDVHLIGLVHINYEPLKLLERIRIALKERESEDIGVIGQMDMPQIDCHRLTLAGFTEFFTSDRQLLEMVSRLLDELERKSKKA